MFDDKRIHSAVRLHRLVNDARFTPSFDLYAVSNDAEFSTKESAIEATVLPNLSKVKLSTVKLEKWRNKKLADAMGLAGCRMEETTSSVAMYKSIHRYITAGKESTRAPPTGFILPPASIVKINENENYAIFHLSPASNARSSVSFSPHHILFQKHLHEQRRQQHPQIRLAILQHVETQA
jgi:hypothetical protein